MIVLFRSELINFGSFIFGFFGMEIVSLVLFKLFFVRFFEFVEKRINTNIVYFRKIMKKYCIENFSLYKLRFIFVIFILF